MFLETFDVSGFEVLCEDNIGAMHQLRGIQKDLGAIGLDIHGRNVVDIHLKNDQRYDVDKQRVPLLGTQLTVLRFAKIGW